MSITELAPAKINLFLHVCGKRADGYHLLDSLVAFTAFGDEVTVAPADDITLRIVGPFADGLSAGEDNLVVKAARLLARTAPHRGGAQIALEKRLPVASGIGGGSSDAAATLRACARAWGVAQDRLSADTLARALGADVPVCVARRPMRMRGIGETLDPVAALPPAWLVLVNPNKPLATAPVFKALQGRHSGAAPAIPARFTDARALAAFLRECTNDLAAPAAELLPDISTVLAAIAQARDCLLARLSGSGPTCFGLFGDEAGAKTAASVLAHAHPDWWVVASPLLRAS